MTKKEMEIVKIHFREMVEKANALIARGEMTEREKGKMLAEIKKESERLIGENQNE